MSIGEGEESDGAGTTLRRLRRTARVRARRRGAAATVPVGTGFVPPPYPYDRLSNSVEPDRCPAGSLTCRSARRATRHPRRCSRRWPTADGASYPQSIGSPALRLTPTPRSNFHADIGVNGRSSRSSSPRCRSGCSPAHARTRHRVVSHPATRWVRSSPAAHRLGAPPHLGSISAEDSDRHGYSNPTAPSTTSRQQPPGQRVQGCRRRISADRPRRSSSRVGPTAWWRSTRCPSGPTSRGPARRFLRR